MKAKPIMELEREPHASLVASILLLAVEDLTSTIKENRISAQRFLFGDNSKISDWYIGLLGQDAVAFKRALRKQYPQLAVADLH